MNKLFLIGSLGLVFMLIFLLYRFHTLAINSQSMTPKDIGLSEGQLHGCGPQPNCVSSLDETGERFIASFDFKNSDEKGFSDIVQTLAEDEQAEIESFSADYAHLIFKTRLFGFVDDLELHHKPKEGKVDVRSKSRVGYSDLGANAKRVEKIRAKYF